jgi:hypothetical protein
MRHIILYLLACLLLTACTVGVTRREALVPGTSSAQEATQSPGATQTTAPVASDTPTETPVPTVPDTPTETLVPQQGTPLDGWRGTIVKLPPGAQFDDYFEREDGQRFGIGGTAETIDVVKPQIDEFRWTGAQVQVWGELLTSVPDYEGRQIAVERIEAVSGPAEEARNLAPFAETAASSFLPTDRGGQYQSWMAVDGTFDTAWVEGVTGSGVGEWITLTFPGTIEVHSISLDVGYDRDDDIFFANNRVKKVTLTFSGAEQVELDFADIRGTQTIPLVRAPSPNIETTFVTLTIEDIYPGTEYNDTCLAEIEIWGKTKSEPTSTPGPTLIIFSPGATSATVEGTLNTCHDIDNYRLQAMEGQTMHVTVTSPDGEAIVAVTRQLPDGTWEPLVWSHFLETSVQIPLPATGNYDIDIMRRIAVAGNCEEIEPTPVNYALTIEIPPLPSP